MPWCRPRFAPVIYVLFFYAMYMLMVFPIMELLGYGLKILMGIDIGQQSSMSRWIYAICLMTFVPCYIAIFYMSWIKHRAKPLFTPKWKTSEPLVEDDVQCTICYDLIVDPRTLRCQHSFCKKCIDQCLPLTRRCPSCQQWVYWSRKNKLFKSKVLRWVKEHGREDEYEEVVAIKKGIKPVKVGCWAKFWPLVLPFFEIPERENQRRNHIRRRPLRGAVIEPVPRREPESLIVNVVDEIEALPIPRPSSPFPSPSVSMWRAASVPSDLSSCSPVKPFLEPSSVPTGIPKCPSILSTVSAPVHEARTAI